MKIKSIKKIGNRPVYDISVGEVEQYVLSNGVITHNTGLYYSANQIFIIGRSQEKASSGEVEGWNFTLNVEKSRFVKEKSKCPIKVTYDGGIDSYSGLLEWALESGHVIKGSKPGTYISSFAPDAKPLKEKQTSTREFWAPILADESFKEFVKNKFMISTKRSMQEEIDSDEVDELED